MLIPIIILVLFFITILWVIICIKLNDQNDHHLYLCARLHCLQILYNRGIQSSCFSDDSQQDSAAFRIGFWGPELSQNQPQLWTVCFTPSFNSFFSRVIPTYIKLGCLKNVFQCPSVFHIHWAALLFPWLNYGGCANLKMYKAVWSIPRAPSVFNFIPSVIKK